ncbi:MAG TPA: CoA transferase [Burkholderiaceae bacterium]|nr:CoA transferase [Burkholderiaceae bacterium]
MSGASASGAPPGGAASASGADGGGPLAGLRVLDLTAVLMGPFATQILGDMGADVIKVEAPSGDTSRGIGPMRHPGMGGGFLQVNRNKRGVCIDLKTEAGRGVLLELARGADVLVYNVRPAAMKRLRLTWEDVSAVNPRIVHAGVFGYGQDGPYAAYPAYDDLIQGAIGLPALLARTGDGTPRYVPIVFVDRAVGMAAVNAILAALVRRGVTGRGQAVEVPMFETMVPFVLGEHIAGHAFEPPLGPIGYPRLLAPERRPYETLDGHVCAVIYTDRHWRAFYEMTGRADAFDRDERVRTIGERTRHMAALHAETAGFVRGDTTARWLERLTAADIPCMRLNTPETLLHDPQLEAVGFFERVEHPSEGAIRQMRPAAAFSEPGRATTLPAPRLGQHTREVLREAGYDDDAVGRLIDAGAVFEERR